MKNVFHCFPFFVFEIWLFKLDINEKAKNLHTIIDDFATRFMMLFGYDSFDEERSKISSTGDLFFLSIFPMIIFFFGMIGKLILFAIGSCVACCVCKPKQNRKPQLIPTIIFFIGIAFMTCVLIFCFYWPTAELIYKIYDIDSRIPDFAEDFTGRIMSLRNSANAHINEIYGNISNVDYISGNFSKYLKEFQTVYNTYYNKVGSAYDIQSAANTFDTNWNSISSQCKFENYDLKSKTEDISEKISLISLSKINSGFTSLKSTTSSFYRSIAYLESDIETLEEASSATLNDITQFGLTFYQFSYNRSNDEQNKYINLAGIVILVFVFFYFTLFHVCHAVCYFHQTSCAYNCMKTNANAALSTLAGDLIGLYAVMVLFSRYSVCNDLDDKITGIFSNSKYNKPFDLEQVIRCPKTMSLYDSLPDSMKISGVIDNQQCVNDYEREVNKIEITMNPEDIQQITNDINFILSMKTDVDSIYKYLIEVNLANIKTEITTLLNSNSYSSECQTAINNNKATIISNIDNLISKMNVNTISEELPACIESLKQVQPHLTSLSDVLLNYKTLFTSPSSLYLEDLDSLPCDYTASYYLNFKNDACPNIINIIPTIMLGTLLLAIAGIIHGINGCIRKRDMLLDSQPEEQNAEQNDENELFQIDNGNSNENTSQYYVPPENNDNNNGDVHYGDQPSNSPYSFGQEDNLDQQKDDDESDQKNYIVDQQDDV